MKMTILPRDDDITHVVLAGRLDATGTEEISHSFAEATVAQKRPAVVDLSQVDFMASRGIGLLLINGKRLLKTGHQLVLLQPKELVESVLRTGKVDRVLPIAHTWNEAVEILQGVPGQSATVGSVAATAPDHKSRPERPAVSEAVPVSEGQLQLTIKNELSELNDLNSTLAQFLDAHHVPRKPAYAVNLAIDELVVNVMRYAYVDDDTHLIDVEVAVAGEQIILRIVDDGRPFDPRRGPSLDLHAEEREAGGLGLLLVLEMVDVLKYQRVEEKNCVEVRVHLLADDNQDDLPTGA